MNRKKKFNHKWIVLTAGVIIFAFGGLEHSAANEAAFSEALYSLPHTGRRTLPAVLHSRTENSIHSKEVDREKSASGLLMDANIRVKQYELRSPGKTGTAVAAPHIPKTLTVIGPLAPDAGSSSTQPLMGIIWNHGKEGRRKWNIVLGLGGLASPPDGFAPFDIRDQILENDDIADQIRNAIQVIGFEIRYHF